MQTPATAALVMKTQDLVTAHLVALETQLRRVVVHHQYLSIQLAN